MWKYNRPERKRGFTLIIDVNISGPPKAGKTAIAFILAKALAEAGIACEVSDSEPGGWKKFQNDRLAALTKTNVLVKVETKDGIVAETV